MAEVEDVNDWSIERPSLARLSASVCRRRCLDGMRLVWTKKCLDGGGESRLVCWQAKVEGCGGCRRPPSDV